MAAEIKIVLFEDSAQTQSQILAALRKCAGDTGRIVPFDSGKSGESEDDQKLMYEDRLERILRRPPYDKTTLLFADRDLSKSQNFIGMSVSAVTGAANRLSVPVCSYARQPAGFVNRNWPTFDHSIWPTPLGESALCPRPERSPAAPVGRRV